MSLLKRNKDKQLAAEKKLAARHAIVKMGVDRNVRDAYFQGLVFAAVANDDQIDESERARLRELGEAMELSAEDVAEAIQCLADKDDDAKMGVIEECARQLTNVEVAECFLNEFSELWLLGGGDKDEFGEFKSQLVDWMGDDVRAAEDAKGKAAAVAEVMSRAKEAKDGRLQKIKREAAQTRVMKTRKANGSVRYGTVVGTGERIKIICKGAAKRSHDSQKTQSVGGFMGEIMGVLEGSLYAKKRRLKAKK